MAAAAATAMSATATSTSLSNSPIDSPSSQPPPSSSPLSSASSFHSSLPTTLLPLPSSSSSSTPASSSFERRLPADDDCCICFNGDSEEDNPILFCDGPGCNCVVHQSCYGVQAIPEGDWLCDSCAVKADPSKAAHPGLLTTLNRCLLCPHTDGALKPAASGLGWVHAACAIWTPETGFADAEKVDVVIGLETIDRNRWRLLCDVCGVKGGCCVQCLGAACRWSCHVLCGWKAGHRMEMQVVGTEDDIDVVKLVYCDRHRGDTWNHAMRKRRGWMTVRLNDTAATSAASSSSSSSSLLEADAPRRPRMRKDADVPRESGYRCIRCDSRTRKHECTRGVGDADEERSGNEEVEEEEDDADLAALYATAVASLTDEHREQLKEDERQEAAHWDLVQADIDHERDEKRRAAERERRQLEGDRAAAAADDSALNDELRRVQEKEEEAFIMADDDDAKPPHAASSRKRKRANADDADYVASAELPTPPVKRKGRPKGSKTRARRCARHLEMKLPCPPDCPDRPPPLTDEELQAREEERKSRGKPRKSVYERMSTTAPGQRQLLKTGAPTTTSSSSPPPASATPLSPTHPHGTSVLPPPPVHHALPPPLPVVLPPLSASPSAVVTRPDKPFTYNPRNTADIQQRISTLLSASSPPTQVTLIKQLVLDSPAAFYREVDKRLREEKGAEVLLRWLKEGREQQAWALVASVMEALRRMCCAEWTAALVRPLTEEVTRNRGAVSQGLRLEADKLWKRMVELALVKDVPQPPVAASLSALPSLSAQIAGTAVIGAGPVTRKVKEERKMEAEAEAKEESKGGRAKEEEEDALSSAVPPHPPAAAVKAAVERLKGREGLRRKVASAAPVVTVSASSRYRAAQEDEKRRRERAVEREYQAGIGDHSVHRPPSPNDYPHPLQPQGSYHPPAGSPSTPGSHFPYSVSPTSALQAALAAANGLLGQVQHPPPSLDANAQALHSLQRLRDIAASSPRINGFHHTPADPSDSERSPEQVR